MERFSGNRLKERGFITNKTKEAYNRLYLPYHTIMSEGALTDWYISSVSEEDTPVWTDEHIEELYNDFYVIPKDVEPITASYRPTGKWVPATTKPTKEWVCTNCHGLIRLPVYSDCYYEYCPNCGAIMTTYEEENNMIEYDDNDNPHWEYEKEVNELLKKI